MGGAWRWDPNTLAAGGAGGVRKGRSRQEIQVLSLAGNREGVGEGTSSLLTLGLGGEARLVGFGEDVPLPPTKEVSSTFTLLGCRKCFITRSGSWSSLLKISPAGNSDPNQCSSLHGTIGRVFLVHTKTIALQSSAI